MTISYLIELAKRAYADGHDDALAVLMDLTEREPSLPAGPLAHALSLIPGWLVSLWYTDYSFQMREWAARPG